MLIWGPFIGHVDRNLQYNVRGSLPLSKRANVRAYTLKHAETQIRIRIHTQNTHTNAYTG